MNIKETAFYIFVFVFFNALVFLMFAFAYLEKIEDTIETTIEMKTPEEVLEEKYPGAHLINFVREDCEVFEISGMHFISTFKIQKRINETQVICIELDDLVLDLFNNKYFLIAMAVMTINMMFLYYNIVYKRKIEERQKAFIENKLQFQTTLVLTENLHHELNTPLAVINNKIKKLWAYYERGTPREEMVGDYKATQASLKVISDILERLKAIKHIKSYESHRTFFEIVKSSLEMMKISNSDHFDYEIDDRLKDYKVNGEFMRSGEISGIILNHVKNSIEADATIVSFSFGGFNGGKLTIFIGDNGNGIPKNIRGDIFSENFSSKDGIRGNGLYINRFLLRNSGGDVTLINSSVNGTAFSISVPAIPSTQEERESADSMDYVAIKSLETEIANKDILFQQFIDSLPDMAWLKDVNGKYMIANKAIKEGLLFDDDPIGKGDVEMALAAKRRFGDQNHTFGEKCSNSDAITLEKLEPSRFLESGKVKGRMMYLEVYKNVILDIDGNIIGVCGTGRDLTEYVESVNAIKMACGDCHVSKSLGVFDKYRFGDDL